MITAIPADRVEDLRDAGFKIIMPDRMNLVWFFSLNQDDENLSDVRVRQAINYAIDREKIANELLRDTAMPVWRMVPGTSSLFDPDSRAYPYDPERARSLLAEAGKTEGFETTLQVPTGGSYMIDPVGIAEWVQRDLAAVGIKVNIEFLRLGHLSRPLDRGAQAGGRGQRDGLGHGLLRVLGGRRDGLRGLRQHGPHQGSAARRVVHRVPGGDGRRAGPRGGAEDLRPGGATWPTSCPSSPTGCRSRPLSG